MARGIVGALGDVGDLWSNLAHNVITPVAAVVASPFTAGASLSLIRGKKYAQQKVFTKGVANVAIPVAATVGAVALTIVTAGAAAPLIGVAAGGIAAGVKKNAENQQASAAANAAALTAQTQRQEAQAYAAAHPVLAQIEGLWQEHPTEILIGAGLLGLLAIIQAVKR